MTIWSIGQDIAKFLKKELPCDNVYAGYLPRIESSLERNKRNPSVAVRVDEVIDGVESRANLKIYVLTFDDDMKQGCMSLYNRLSEIRYLLMKNNPIMKKYHFNLRQEEMVMTIPDEQPYPFWLGSIEVAIRIESIKEEIENGILSWS